MDNVKSVPPIKSSILLFVVLSWIFSLSVIWGVYKYSEEIECDLKRGEVEYFRHLSEQEEYHCD